MGEWDGENLRSLHGVNVITTMWHLGHSVSHK